MTEPFAYPTQNERPKAAPAFEIDPVVAEFTRAIWKPGRARRDPEVTPPTFDEHGQILGPAEPPLGPENPREVVTMLTFRLMNALRLPDDPDLKPRLTIDRTGRILGPTGFTFDPETPEERAFLERRP